MYNRMIKSVYLRSVHLLIVLGMAASMFLSPAHVSVARADDVGEVNDPPELTLDNLSVTVNEGQMATNSGTVSDLDGDVVTLTASIGSLTGYSDGTWSWSYTPEDGPEDSQMVTITADDGNGGAGQATFDLNVNNVAPEIVALSLPSDPVQVGIAIDFTTIFTDPGVLDAHDVYWMWGDGSTDTVDLATSPTSIAHTYTEPGAYTIALTVSDDDNSATSGTSEYVVVYDPDGGFVTGGGWIDSPAGAYTDDPSLTGKATFGFVSKYKKGASIPSGNTEFQFQAGRLNFHSEAYDWLVVNQGGSNAQFKGSGAVNDGLDPNGDPYKFMLWAGDGTGAYGADTFRIKIWWQDASGVETVVYDNGSSQPIGAGSIVVHNK